MFTPRNLAALFSWFGWSEACPVLSTMLKLKNVTRKFLCNLFEILTALYIDYIPVDKMVLVHSYLCSCDDMNGFHSSQSPLKTLNIHLIFKNSINSLRPQVILHHWSPYCRKRGAMNISFNLIFFPYLNCSLYQIWFTQTSKLFQCTSSCQYLRDSKYINFTHYIIDCIFWVFNIPRVSWYISDNLEPYFKLLSTAHHWKNWLFKPAPQLMHAFKAFTLN